jgi:hypothetical protein
MRRFVAVAILIASFGSLAISAPRQGNSQGKGRGEANKPAAKETKEAKENNGGGVVFGGSDSRIIRDWFSSPTNLKGLPPGLAKKDRLPPGLEKQLRRNGSLPPGLEKKIQPLPRDLEVRLPRLPDGQRRVIIPGSVILMDSKRNLILDILSNLF